MIIVDRNIAPEIKTAPGDISMPEAKTFRMDNGVPVTMINKGDQDVHRLTLMWDGGEVEAMAPSVANLTVQLLREGSRNMTGEEISDGFDRNGAWVKGVAQAHNTSVVAHVLNHTVDDVYRTLFEMVTEPIFPAEALTVIRESFAGHLETNLKRVDYISQIAIKNMMFGIGHPMARQEIPDTVRSINADELLRFHSLYLHPDGIHIYLAGKITDRVLECLNKTFGTKSVHKDGSHGHLSIIPPQRHADDDKCQVKHVDGASQSSVRMAIPVIDRNTPDYIPLRMAVMALGGYFGSRLMSNIREEKGLTYGINAGLYGYREGSMVMISAQTSNETVAPLIDETRKEIEYLKTGKMSDDELIRLKRHMVTQLLTQLDTPFAIMDYYENLHLNDIRGDYFRQQWNAINSMSYKKIGEMANKYLDTDKMLVAVAGDSNLINI